MFLVLKEMKTIQPTAKQVQRPHKSKNRAMVKQRNKDGVVTPCIRFRETFLDSASARSCSIKQNHIQHTIFLI